MNVFVLILTVQLSYPSFGIPAEVELLPAGITFTECNQLAEDITNENGKSMTKEFKEEFPKLDIEAVTVSCLPVQPNLLPKKEM